jgi:hypothetical protein
MNDTVEHPQKNFSIKPSENPDQLLAIRLREGACEDAKLSDGAYRMFSRLIDLALNPFHNNGHKGRVVISQADLGKLINCDERSIRRRGSELIDFNYLWTSLMPRRNTKPITIYHITAFFPQKKVAQDIPGEGLRVNGARRHDHGFERTGKEAGGRQRRMGGLILDQFGKQIFFDLPANAPESGQNWPRTADSSVLSERTVASSARGHFRPLTEDSSVLSERSKLSAHSGQNCPQSEDGSVRLHETQLEPESGKKEGLTLRTKRGISSKGLKPASRGKGQPWPQGLKPLPLEEERAIETLRSLAEVYNGVESALDQRERFGKQWRMRTREDISKMGRVLAEVRDAAKEGRITGLVGEYFNKIWNEFAGKAVAK